MAITNADLFNLDAGILHKDACIVIVRTEWNAHVVDILENGCLSIFSKYEITNYKVITVPGAFEIPFAIKSFWDNTNPEKPHAFIALGCVIRGDTPHFDYVCKAITDGVVQLNLSLPVPTIFGVLTVDNEEQAAARTGGAHGNKGEEAAITALKMVALQNSFYKQ